MTVCVAKTIAQVRAISAVSLDMDAGEALGLVGEPGCRESILGRRAPAAY